MSIYKPTKANISYAASIIRSGGIVSFPTETVYGLGADIFNTAGITKIFEAKNRPFFDPLIAHIAALSQLALLSPCHPPIVNDLAKKFWPGPLTMVLPKRETVPDIATSGLTTIAVRMPDHPVACALIRESGIPIAAPSANPFGYLSPTCAEHVARSLGERVPVIIDGGACTVGVESTIIKVGEDKITLLRPGGIAAEEIEMITGPLAANDSVETNPEAPGNLPWHYAPKKRLFIVSSIEEIRAEEITGSEKNVAFLLYKKKNPAILQKIPRENITFLSEDGNLAEAASNIFSALHYLDRLPVKAIFAEEVPKTGLGMAIMDRLLKASKKYIHEE